MFLLEIECSWIYETAKYKITIISSLIKCKHLKSKLFWSKPASNTCTADNTHIRFRFSWTLTCSLYRFCDRLIVLILTIFVFLF